LAKKTGKRSTAKNAALRRIRSLPTLPHRKRAGHKGCYGRVLVIGGSRGMIGAPSLAANAALRSGAGLATVACPRSIQLTVATLCPCATTIPLPEGATGMIDPRRAIKELRSLGLLDAATAPSVVAAGPGLGRGDDRFDRAWLSLLGVLGKAGVPIVVDADGLNAMHKSSTWNGPGWDDTRHYRTVITPHPGEMAALHDTTTAKVQRDREDFAVKTAKSLSHDPCGTGVSPVSSNSCGTGVSPVSSNSCGTGVSPVSSNSCGTGVSPVSSNSCGTGVSPVSSPPGRRCHKDSGMGIKQTSTRKDDPDHRAVVVLKGAGTVVTDGINLYKNKSGNPGMATGGSGDVLTGVIAALIGQDLSTLDAAILGVHIHGLAGDLAAKDLGEVSLMASDLIDYLPAAFRRLR